MTTETTLDTVTASEDAPAKKKLVEKIALTLTVDEAVYSKTLQDLGVYLITSNKVFFENFKKFVDEHFAHTEITLHERLFMLSDETVTVDGVDTIVKHPILDIRVGSLLVSGKRSIYDITVYGSINPNGDQEFLFPIPMDILRGATTEQVKQILDTSATAALTSDEMEEFNKNNPDASSVFGLVLNEDPNIVEGVLDTLMDISDLADHMDQ